MMMENGLSLITVRKNELLEALEKNLGTHRSTFLEAQKGYRVAVIEVLDKMLKDAREGRQIRTIVELEEPQDMSKDYQRTIRMLQMSVKDEVQITEREFAQFVLDDWSWKAQFVSTSNMYNNTR